MKSSKMLAVFVLITIGGFAKTLEAAQINDCGENEICAWGYYETNGNSLNAFSNYVLNKYFFL